jgi:hypothetical protein
VQAEEQNSNLGTKRSRVYKDHEESGIKTTKRARVQRETMASTTTEHPLQPTELQPSISRQTDLRSSLHCSINRRFASSPNSCRMKRTERSSPVGKRKKFERNSNRKARACNNQSELENITHCVAEPFNIL